MGVSDERQYRPEWGSRGVERTRRWARAGSRRTVPARCGLDRSGPVSAAGPAWAGVAGVHQRATRRRADRAAAAAAAGLGTPGALTGRGPAVPTRAPATPHPVQPVGAAPAIWPKANAAYELLDRAQQWR